jgi:hypothetical protein
MRFKKTLPVIPVNINYTPYAGALKLFIKPYVKPYKPRIKKAIINHVCCLDRGIYATMDSNGVITLFDVINDVCECGKHKCAHRDAVNHYLDDRYTII